MKKTILAVATILAASALFTFAADAKKELSPQQQRMADCSSKSKGMKGDAHKKFMSDCLKGDAGTMAAAKPTQQEKMKTCNAEAGGKKLKGDERKAFMSSCLKG